MLSVPYCFYSKISLYLRCLEIERDWMKEFVISEAQTEKAVIVGLVTQTQDERKTNEYWDELAFLAETEGGEVEKRFQQKLDTHT